MAARQGAQADLAFEPVEESLLQARIDDGEAPELRNCCRPAQADAEVGGGRHLPRERCLKVFGPIETRAVVGEPLGRQRSAAQTGRHGLRQQQRAGKRRASGKLGARNQHHEATVEVRP